MFNKMFPYVMIAGLGILGWYVLRGAKPPAKVPLQPYGGGPGYISQPSASPTYGTAGGVGGATGHSNLGY